MDYRFQSGSEGEVAVIDDDGDGDGERRYAGAAGVEKEAKA